MRNGAGKKPRAEITTPTLEHIEGARRFEKTFGSPPEKNWAPMQSAIPARTRCVG